MYLHFCPQTRLSLVAFDPTIPFLIFIGNNLSGLFPVCPFCHILADERRGCSRLQLGIDLMEFESKS